MRYFFIEDEIYYEGKKQPPRKTELFDVSIAYDKVFGYDENGNCYTLNKEQVVTESEE